MIQNPIISGFNPDPSICRVGDDYYLVTSSFEYFPGIPLYHSTNLLEWELIGYCLTRPSQLCLDNAYPSSGLWAPTIRYNNGVFYMTTTNMAHGGNFYVTTTDPRGEWSDPIWVAMEGIDPSFYFEDGKAYYSTNMTVNGQTGIAMAEIDIATGKLRSEIRHIWSGTGGLAPEGAHIYRIDDYYYLMIAEGGTHYGHMETIARSKNIWGPYESCPRNPILTNRNIAFPIQAVGHADLIQTANGDWRIVFLAIRNSGGMFHHLGRETFLLPVEWDQDKWPVVNKNGTAGYEIDLPENKLITKKQYSFHDDFSGEKLNLNWNFVRTPKNDFFDLSDDGIILRSNGVSITELDSPSMICMRQKHLDADISVKMNFAPKQNGDRSGLVIYRNAWYFYELSLVQKAETKVLILRKKLGDIDIVVHEEPYTGDEITFVVKAEALNYRFGYQRGDKIIWIGSGRTQFLAAEASEGVFTGVFIGLFAESEDGTCESRFLDVEYVESSDKDNH